jgi:hypothetical protein
MIRKTEQPGFYCSDPEVQAFCEQHAYDFSGDKASRRTARQLIDAAIKKFGWWKVYDIKFFLH